MSTPAPRVEIVGVPGMPEVRPGDDLVGLLAAGLADGAIHLADGDIVVVTSKIVSKAEGRVRAGVDREEAIDAESVRTVAEWTTPNGRTRIVETRHGFVMAAAGVDASNVEPGSVVLLPLDPDASARALREGLRQRFGAQVGVVVTDTAGRAWRNGVVDFAVGTAGVQAVDDLRGRQDRYGNDLGVTVVAVADELAAASELVRTKLSQVPVAVVRGLAHLLLPPDDDTGASALVRPSAEDRFRLGTPEAMRAAVTERPVVAGFTARGVDHALVRRALTATLSAAQPLGRSAARFVLVESEAARAAIVEAGDDDGLRSAPALVLACTSDDDEHALLELGAAVEGLAVALWADGLACAWLPSTPALPGAASSLDLPTGWRPAGILAIGRPTPDSRPSSTTAADAVVTR